MTTIYLAHHGNKKTKNICKFLQDVLEREGHEVINPFDHDKEAQKLTCTWDQKPQKRNQELADKIVLKDRIKIVSCDIVLAFVKEPSIGTSMEIFYAHLIGKPVYIITEYQSPWLLAHGKVCKLIDEVMELIT